jgi:hypothetical protein
LIVASHRKALKSVSPVSTAERARAERLEFAELLGLEETRQLSREARLRQWMGADYVYDPTTELEESE